MIVAATQREIYHPQLKEIDSLERTYSDYFAEHGITHIPLPNIGSEIKSYLKNFALEGVILTGGNDIDPKLYGSKTNRKGSYSKSRDETETVVLEFAIENSIPVLGICRGAQFINVYFGGTLNEDLKEIGFQHVAITHPVSLDMTYVKRAVTNSYHNQGFLESGVAKDLEPFAVADDGIVEGVYHPHLQIAGIMWHPERENSCKDVDETIMNSFKNAKLFWRK